MAMIVGLCVSKRMPGRKRMATIALKREAKIAKRSAETAGLDRRRDAFSGVEIKSPGARAGASDHEG